jgi:MEDS: MEthanogen/methylotroph, DcmR Sensory domain
LEPLKPSPDDLFSAARIDLLSLHQPAAAHHCVCFYDRDSFVIEAVAYLAAKALETGASSVLVATGPHLEAVENRLAVAVPDLPGMREAGRYVGLRAEETLEQLLAGGFPQKAKFDAVVGEVIRRAVENSANGFVFAFGEMVALLCAKKRPDAALRLEQLWNSLAAKHRFSLCCAYPLDTFADEPDPNSLLRICSEHSLVIPAETPL